MARAWPRPAGVAHADAMDEASARSALATRGSLAGTTAATASRFFTPRGVLARP